MLSIVRQRGQLRVASDDSLRRGNSGVGQTHLAGTRRRATADEREMRRSVVWRAEWPRSEQRALGIDEAGDAVDRARDDRLIGIERGQERRDRASKERLARSRRSDEEEAVPAGGSDLERSLGRL